MDEDKNELTETLIKYIVTTLKEKNLGFGETRLVKIIYIIEYEYYKSFKKRLTNLEWKFIKYGPYPLNFKSILESLNITIYNDDDYNKIVVEKDFKKNNINIPFLRPIIENTIDSFGDINLNKLLDYVYFETEPMLEAERGGDIDFNVEYIKEKKMILSSDFRKKLRKLGKSMKNSLDKIDLENLLIINKTPNNKSNYAMEYFDENK